MNWINKVYNKNNIINLSLLLGSIIFALILAEIILRIFIPINKIIPDPILGHRIDSRINDYDKNGFYNSFIPDKAEIVVLGDSQTRGNNTKTSDQAWPQILEKISGESVYQMAVDGYGPVQYSYLIDNAFKFNPKIIIVGFYTGNDLLDTVRLVYSNENWKHLRSSDFVLNKHNDNGSDIISILQSGYKPGSWKFKILKIRQWLRSKSYLYTFLGRSTRNLRENLGLAETKSERNKRIAEKLKNEKIAFVYDKQPISSLLSPSYRFNSVNLDNLETKEGLRIAKELFLQMSDKAKEHGAIFIIVIIPTKEMVYGNYFQDTDEPINSNFSEFLSKEKELKNTLLQFCKKNDIYCIDVLPSLVNSLERGEKIYPEEMDGHPIPTGYAVIARSIYEFLKENNILEK